MTHSARKFRWGRIAIRYIPVGVDPAALGRDPTTSPFRRASKT